jgi:hypothetical protein
MSRRSGFTHRVYGLSKATIRHSGKDSQHRTNVLKAGKQNERQTQNDKKRRAAVEGEYTYIPSS